METIKKTIGKFFYLEYIWFLLPCIALVVPEENTSPSHSDNAIKSIGLIEKVDLQFLIKVSEGNLMEVKLGELAQHNASSAEVKKFGKVMMEDHTKLKQEITTIANSKQIVLPETLDKKLLKKYNNMADKKGADFDKSYISNMIDDHKKDISFFEKQAKNGLDPEIKNWATNKITMLKHHLHLANEAYASLKKQ